MNQINDSPTKGILILQKSLHKNIYKRAIIAMVFVRDVFHQLGNDWLLGYVSILAQVKKIRWFHH